MLVLSEDAVACQKVLSLSRLRVVVQWSDPDSKAKWWRCCGVGTGVEGGLVWWEWIRDGGRGGYGWCSFAAVRVLLCLCVITGGRKGSEVLEQKISLLSPPPLSLSVTGPDVKQQQFVRFHSSLDPKKLWQPYTEKGREARRNGGVGWCYELNKGNLKDRGKWKYVGWGKLQWLLQWLVDSFCFRSKVVTRNSTETVHRNKNVNWNMN